MLDQVTPVILTYNEEANIGRSLAKLRWAKRIVVLDSGSTDRTIEIANSFANVELFHRKFDTHAQQWAFAVHETSIDTLWVLRLDADYIVTDGLVEEIRGLVAAEDIVAFMVHFRYAVNGKVLRSSLYPPNAVLFRRGTAKISQTGHTERWLFDGPIDNLRGVIIHDDRKSLNRWLESQLNYARREADYVMEVPTAALSLTNRVRKLAWPTPIIVFLYVLIVKRVILDGRAGWTYALQRLVAEAILALHLMNMRSDRQ